MTAPLANRPQHSMSRKYRGWSYGICWAMSASYAQSNIYQLLFDYLIRNLNFWKHYAKDLRMEYIFFVKDGRVARVSFSKILVLAKSYKLRAGSKNLRERRLIADGLMGRLLKFT